MIHRALALLALGGSLLAAEPAYDFTFQSTGPSTFSLQPGRDETAQGDVKATYQGISLACEHLTYRLIGLPGIRINILDAAVLTALPDQVVRLDTRSCTLPRMSLRGLLTPARIAIARTTEASPGAVAWAVDLDRCGDADFALLGSQGWSWHHLWAHQARLVVEAPLLPDGSLGAIRLVSARFDARPDPGDGSGRLARLDRFPVSETPPATGTAPIGGIEATSIRITADSQGRIQASTAPGMVRFFGQGLSDLRGSGPRP